MALSLVYTVFVPRGSKSKGAGVAIYLRVFEQEQPHLAQEYMFIALPRFG